MKKTLSLALVFCMLFAMVLPLSVSAEDGAESALTVKDVLYYEQYDSTKTYTGSEHISNTGWDAYKGTPTVDGTKGTDEAWNNALPLVLNSQTTATINDINSKYSGANAEYYLMWDKDYLYYLEVNNNFNWSGLTKTSIDSGNLWTGGYNGTQLNFLMGADTTAEEGNVIKLYQLNFMPIEKNGTAVSALTNGTQYQGSNNMRYKESTYYGTKEHNGNTYTNAFVQTRDDGFKAVNGVETYFTKTGDKGLVMEAKIAWSTLGVTGEVTKESLSVFGVGVYTGDTKAILLNKYGETSPNKGISVQHGDFSCSFDPIYLLNDKSEAEGGANRTMGTAITPNTDYWVGESGVLKTAGKGTYQIDTAEKLLGLSYAMENYAYDANTKGKTFVLTKDIDLNPGVDWSKYADGTLPSQYAMYWQKSVLNVWLSLDEFYGVFDGQGHTISGIYSNNAAHGSSSATGDWGIFGGRQADGGVKNVIIDNGYICDNDGGGFGTVFGVCYNRQSGDVSVFAENIYVGNNFYMKVNKSDGQAGAIMAGYWSNVAGNTFKVTCNNVVFDGNIIVAATNRTSEIGAFFGVWRAGEQGSANAKTTFSTTLTDCLFTGTAKDDAGINKTITDTFTTHGTRCGNKVTAVPEANEGYWVATKKGVMPVVLADMMSSYTWQSSMATSGKYDVRLVAEIASLNYDSVGFEVTVKRTKDSTTQKATTGNKDNTTVYTGVKANGVTKTAADLNSGFLDGEENALVTFTLNNLDTSYTYELEVVLVYTMDGVQYRSAVAHTATVSAYVAA